MAVRSPETSCSCVKRPFGEEGFHQRLVGLGHHLEQLLAGHRCLIGQVGRDLALRHLAGVRSERQRLHADEIDDPGEVAFIPDRQLDRNDLAGTVAMERLEGALEAGALALEAIQHDDAGKVECRRFGPELLGLHFDAGNSVDDHGGSFCHAERGLGVGQEIGKPRRVDDVDLGLLPLGVGQARGQRVLAGDLFLVEVGDRRPVVYLAKPVDRTRNEEHGRNQLGLAAPSVSDDSDVADGGGVVDLHRGYPSCRRQRRQAWCPVAADRPIGRKAGIIVTASGGRKVKRRHRRGPTVEETIATNMSALAATCDEYVHSDTFRLHHCSDAPSG